MRTVSSDLPMVQPSKLATYRYAAAASVLSASLGRRISRDCSSSKKRSHDSGLRSRVQSQWDATESDLTGQQDAPAVFIHSLISEKLQKTSDSFFETLK